MNEITPINTAPLAPVNVSAQLAVWEPEGTGYRITGPDNTVRLDRDVDFGNIANTSHPCLFKAGAEKVAFAFGCLQHYDRVTTVEDFSDPDKPFCFYTFKCSLIKIVNGTPYTWVEGYGSANTKERRNGRNGAYDSANATLKMAKKRALVDAAISLAGLSSAFTQDLEAADFIAKADLITKETPDSPITAQQIKRLFAVAGDVGLTQAEAKKVLADMGYASTKAVLQKDYNAVIDAIKQKGNNNG